MEPRDTPWEEIKIGETASFSQCWTQEDVNSFASLSGDYNPLHIDTAYASTTQFGSPIVHGMLVASLSSRLVGMYLPGKRCLLLKNEILFKKPVFIGDTIMLIGTVVSKSNSTKILSISTSFRNINTDLIVAEGEVTVTLI